MVLCFDPRIHNTQYKPGHVSSILLLELSDGARGRLLEDLDSNIWRRRKNQKKAKVISSDYLFKLYIDQVCDKLGNPLKLSKNFCFSDTDWQQVRKKGKDIQ